MNVFELTKHLLAIPSVSGDEQAVAYFLAEYLTQAGFRVVLQEAAAGRPNLLACLGEPTVVLSTHTDTVPPMLKVREDEAWIYGRGACDAKGILAAMVVAAEQLKTAGTTDFGLLFVVGEEAGSCGARMANSLPNRSRFLINGEPTGSTLAVGSKGALRFKLKATGKAAHAAYPEQGESAIEKLLEVLHDLRHTVWPVAPRLGTTTFNIGEIAGGVAPNVVAPTAEAHLIFRVVSDLASLRRQIEETVGGRAALEYQFACEPVFTALVDGFPTSVAAFTTDIPLLTNWGTPLLFGPGSILDAHTAQEKISKAELVQAVTSYAKLVTMLQHTIPLGAQTGGVSPTPPDFFSGA